MGMLYDYRTEQIVEGSTLWDLDTVEKERKCVAKHFTSSIVTIEKSLLDKTKLLKAEGSLKLSILCDMVKMSGSAEYVKNRKITKRQERVILEYSTYENHETITVDDLKKARKTDVDFPDPEIATHVVIGIVYGADVFFEFSRSLSENEDSTAAQGKSEAVLKFVEKLSVSGSAEFNMNMNGNEKQIAESLTYAFYGDAKLETNPITFEEAVKLFKDIPQLIRSNKTNIAKKVTLCPIELFKRLTGKSSPEIDDGLILKCASLIDGLYHLKIEAEDLMISDYWSIQQNKEHLEKFVKCIERFEAHVKKRMAKLLAEIRGGSAEEDKLNDFLQKADLAPFSTKQLRDWIDSTRDKTIKLNYFIESLKTKPEVDLSDDALRRARCAVPRVIVICLSTHLTSETDPFLEKCDRYFENSEAFNEPNEIVRNSRWDGDVFQKIREKVEFFYELVEANGNDKNIKLVINRIHSDAQDSLEGIFLHVYGHNARTEIQISGKPGKPVITKIESTSIRLKWEKPRDSTDTIEGYKIICEKFDGREWKLHVSESCDSESTSITNLTANTEYRFKVLSKKQNGIAVASDISDSIRTNPQSGLCILC